MKVQNSKVKKTVETHPIENRAIHNHFNKQFELLDSQKTGTFKLSILNDEIFFE